MIEVEGIGKDAAKTEKAVIASGIRRTCRVQRIRQGQYHLQAGNTDQERGTKKHHCEKG